MMSGAIYGQGFSVRFYGYCNIEHHAWRCHHGLEPIAQFFAKIVPEARNAGNMGTMKRITSLPERSVCMLLSLHEVGG